MQFTGYGRFLDKLWITGYGSCWVQLLLMAGAGLCCSRPEVNSCPGQKAREFYVDLEMPEGTQLERTAGAVISLESIIREISGEELGLIYSEIGPTSGLASGGQSLFDDQNMATIKVKLKEDSLFLPTA